MDDDLNHPCLHIASDLGPVGLPASLWLTHGYRIRGTFTWDLAHRLHCAHMAATADSGLVIIRLEMLQAMKLRQGPFKQAAHHTLLQEASQELGQTLTETNILFDSMYESICRDLGEEGPDVGSSAHMASMWKKCVATLTARGKGSNTKDSRWWSFETSARDFLPQASMTLLLLVFVGYKRGWWRSLEACPLFDEDAIFCEESLAQPGEEDGAAHIAPADGGNDAGGRDDDDVLREGEGPTSSRTTLAAGRQEVRKRRSACVSTLMYVSKILAKPLNLRLLRVLSYSPEPLEKWFNNMITQMKTKASVRDLHCRLAGGELGKVAIQVVMHSQSFEYRRHVLQSSGGRRDATQHQINQERAIGQCAWRYLLSLAGTLGLLSLQYQMPPLCFMGLLPSSSRRATLDTLKRTWSTLERLEEIASVTPACAAWCSTMCWPRQQWAREQLLALAEDSFSRVCPMVERQLEMFADSFLTTLPIENLFNSAREASSKSRKGQLEPISVWHHSVCGSQVLADHDMKPAEVSSAARVASAKQVPAKAFRYTDGSCSISDEDFCSLCASSPDWPAISAGSMTMNGMRWQLALATQGNFARMEVAWQSLLVKQGDLVMQRGEKSAQLVLRSSDAGFLHCRAPIIQCGDAYFVRFGEETIVNEVRFNFVGTLSDWKVASAEPVPLAELPANVEPPHAGFIALRFRKPETLLKAAARVGFRGLGVVHLRRLFQQEVPPRPGSRPKSEVAFVDALVRHVFPGCDDAFVEVALQARNPDWSSMWRESSPIFENRFRDEVLDEEDFELAEIKQEYEREMAKVKAQKAATEKKLSTLRSSRRGGSQ